MSEEKKELPKTAWKKGQSSPNPKGRPKNTSRPISRLRSTLNKLKELEPEALEVIAAGIRGEEVDSKRVDNSWKLINSLPVFTRAAISEESFKMDVKEKNEESEKATGTEGAPAKPRLSLKIVSDDE